MITNKDRRLFQVAYSIAGLSTCRYKFGAILVKGARIVSTGVNILKTHPIVDRYGDYCISIHAEYHAILRANTEITGAVMYVARYAQVKASKPCHICMELLREHTISAVCYHNGKELIKEYL